MITVVKRTFECQHIVIAHQLAHPQRPQAIFQQPQQTLNLSWNPPQLMGEATE